MPVKETPCPVPWISLEDHHAQAVARSVVGFFRVDVQGRLLEANQALARLWGYASPEDLLAAAPDLESEIYLDPQGRARLMASLELNGESRGWETRVRLANGWELGVREHLRLVAGPEGDPVWVEGWAWAIPSRRWSDQAGVSAGSRPRADRSRLNEARLQSLYALARRQFDDDASLVRFALDEAVRLTGSEIGYFHFIEDDQVTLRLFAWSARVYEQCRVSPDRHYPLHQAGIWADCARTGQPVIHNDYLRADGRKGYPPGHVPITRHLSVPVMYQGQVALIAGVANKEDLYDQEDVRLLQHFMQGVWEILLRQRADRELQKAKEEAEAANQAKSQFLATMSHEIRTPMNAVLGFTQLALERVDDPQAREHLEIVSQSAEHLLTLIDDILDLAKIESGRIDLECKPFSLREALQGVTDVLFLKAREKGLELLWVTRPEVPDRLRGDSGRLRQVLINLINNAIKFTEQGEILLMVGLEERRDDQATLVFALTDTGIGINPPAQGRIFEFFTQADASHTRKHGGAGLGLAISQRMVRMMGGDIRVDSQSGQGSTFTFTVRLEVVDQEPPQAVAPIPAPVVATPPADRLKVLLVEDNRLNRKLALIFLQRMGCDVDQATNGRDALEMTTQVAYDLVFMDVEMPILDGLSATQVIREREATAGGHLPIVAMTAHSMKGDRQKCLDAGMDDYLTKPLDQNQLQQMVDRARRREL